MRSRHCATALLLGLFVVGGAQAGQVYQAPCQTNLSADGPLMAQERTLITGVLRLAFMVLPPLGERVSYEGDRQIERNEAQWQILVDLYDNGQSSLDSSLLTALQEIKELGAGFVAAGGPSLNRMHLGGRIKNLELAMRMMLRKGLTGRRLAMVGHFLHIARLYHAFLQDRDWAADNLSPGFIAKSREAQQFRALANAIIHLNSGAPLPKNPGR